MRKRGAVTRAMGDDPRRRAGGHSRERELVDTIVALATPPGRGALAVVRWSGPEARRIITTLVPALQEELEPRKVHLVELVDPRSGRSVDRGLLTWFRGPRSYTGEDVAEFSGHGGRLTPRLVLEAVRAAGARPAEPGEFTRRAYLNGRIDLVQAEAVGDLVEGTSTRLQREALRQLDRHLSRRIAELREELLGVEARLAHHIDFPDEDDPPVPVETIAAGARALVARLEALAATAPEGERLRDGALVVLAGRPNVGKSTLYNALVGEERALVTEVPGTTRDALETDVEFEGYPIRLVDTAGLHRSDEVVERLGIEVARRFVDHADLVLHCVPAGGELDAEEAAWAKGLGVEVVRVRTKADGPTPPSGGWAGDEPERPPGRSGAVVWVSAVTGRGLDRLRSVVAGRVFGRLGDSAADAPVLTRRRQREGVERAVAGVRAFETALAAGVPAEFAATHLKEAESALEEVVGLVDTEAVLDRVFASFCIGK